MTRRRFVVAALALCFSALLGGLDASVSAKLPAQLTDHEFWTLVTDLSEPSGTFRSDNLLSNEARFQFIIPELIETATPGRVYIGVGPEQNFTYIAATRPALAFKAETCSCPSSVIFPARRRFGPSGRT